MRTFVQTSILTLAVASMMTSCSLWNNETNGAVLGGLGGAIVGGALGEAVGGHCGSHFGAMVGSTIGTVAGAAAGAEQDRREAEQRDADRYGRGYGDQGYYGRGNRQGYFGGNNRGDDGYGSDYDDNYTSSKSYYDNASGVSYVRVSANGDVAFAPSSHELTSRSRKALDRIAKSLRRCDNEVYVYGSADATEGGAKQLSQRRAGVAARYLVRKGVEARRLHVVALGNTSPIGNDRTASGRALNRSVEVFVIE